jgi:predicted metal-dependent enzyme (double-stranded beta helix superfamily)
MQLSTTEQINPLREFIVQMTKLVEKESSEVALVSESKKYLQTLISTDKWLPEFCTVPHPDYYQQYLLHADPLERFSVVSFVWGPGQKTPVHDHTVWGLIGMLRGAENGQRYEYDTQGKLIPLGKETRLSQGDIEIVSPTIGDIHIVKNAYDDQTSISIHVYGANIGAVARHVYDVETNSVKKFVSGYSSTQVPNLWDRSASVRAHLN